MTYSYEPSMITESGKDKMRFELGDTFAEGGANTCALSDEEYEAVIGGIPLNGRKWELAKLKLLEAICMKMAYQVDTRIDVLSYGYGGRAKLWSNMRDDLRKRLSASAAGASFVSGAALNGGYFFTDMQSNKRRL